MLPFKKYMEQVFIWEVGGPCHFLVPGYKTKPPNQDMAQGGRKGERKKERLM